MYLNLFQLYWDRIQVEWLDRLTPLLEQIKEYWNDTYSVKLLNLSTNENLWGKVSHTGIMRYYFQTTPPNQLSLSTHLWGEKVHEGYLESYIISTALENYWWGKVVQTGYLGLDIVWTSIITLLKRRSSQIVSHFRCCILLKCYCSILKWTVITGLQCYALKVRLYFTRDKPL